MKPLSIRASLTVWFVTLTTLLLLVFSATLYLNIRTSLYDGLDAELRARADGLVALCEWEDETELFEFDPEVASLLGDAHPTGSREVRAWPTGEVLYRSGLVMFPELPEDTGDLPRVWVRFDTVEEGLERPVRLCTMVARVKAPPPADAEAALMVRVGDNLESVGAQLSRIGWFVLLLAAVTLMVVLAFGVLLSKKFVRPLKRLGEAASQVRLGHEARMPRRGTDDEVDHLASILDDSFGALRDALEHQARFTADAAHELRNPISIIHNAAGVALRRERSPAEYAPFLDDILVTARRMGSIVDALLLLARMDAGTARASFEELNLSALAREAADALQHTGESRITVHNGSPAFVKGDPGLLRVMIDNLLSNALRYSDVDSPVEIFVKHEGQRTAVSVQDQGPGIPEQHAARLFDRFYRVEKANPKGSGLGLSIVAEVARLHQAEVEAERLEVGTRFTVSFPD